MRGLDKVGRGTLEEQLLADLREVEMIVSESNKSEGERALDEMEKDLMDINEQINRIFGKEGIKKIRGKND